MTTVRHVVILSFLRENVLSRNGPAVTTATVLGSTIAATGAALSLERRCEDDAVVLEQICERPAVVLDKSPVGCQNEYDPLRSQGTGCTPSTDLTLFDPEGDLHGCYTRSN